MRSPVPLDSEIIIKLCDVAITAREDRLKELESSSDLDAADPNTYMTWVDVIVKPYLLDGTLRTDQHREIQRAVLRYALGTDDAIELALQAIE